MHRSGRKPRDRSLDRDHPGPGGSACGGMCAAGKIPERGCRTCEGHGRNLSSSGVRRGRPVSPGWIPELGAQCPRWCGCPDPQCFGAGGGAGAQPMGDQPARGPDGGGSCLPYGHSLDERRWRWIHSVCLLPLWPGSRQEKPDIHASPKSGIPWQRIGTAQEVADVAVFLCSPRSCWVVGECVSIDGGQHCGMR